MTFQTVPELLAFGRSLAMGSPALGRDGELSMDHDALHALLVKAGAGLNALGFGRATRVMTALPDGPLTACVLLALSSSAICAPVNPDLREAEVAALIPELAVGVLVAHGLCADEARKAAAAMGLPVLEVDWDDQGGLRWSGPPLASAPARAVEAHPDDTALVLLTSGSSARPKRVPLTHRQLALSARRMAASVQLTKEDCCLNLMPMFHVGAVVDLLLAPLSVGGSVLRPDGMSIEAFFTAVAGGRPTWFQGVPTMLHELAAHAAKNPDKNKGNLRFIRSVSSPLPPDWLYEIERALAAPVIEIYGMTETAGVITSNALPPAKRKPGSVGRTTGLEVMVRTDQQTAAATKERGEILVRGPGVMRGYEGIAPDNGGAMAITEDGWLHTGDEGYFDSDGFLFITGRIGEQINRGGEKISPREVDEVLVSHPMVREAAAFAMPHAQLGREVAAAIVVEPGMTAEIHAAGLAEHVAARLAYFKVPKHFYLLEELPRGPGGKLRRRLLPDLVRELPPLGNEPRTDWEAPGTDMEKLVAAWWETELRVAGIGRNGHFFDLGGDSLAAATVTVGIERALGVSIRPAALFDHPTVAAFAVHLEQATMAKPGQKAFLAETTPLHPDFLHRLRAAMSVWAGERKNEFSLLVGRNTRAKGTPVFWCGQGSGEFEGFASRVPDDMPLYAARSLYLLGDKKRHDEAALARMLAREVEEVAAGREMIIGGFCAGGRIAFDVAGHLRESGVPIKMVFLHEVFPSRKIDVPVAVGMTASYALSPFRRFHRAEMVLRKRCPAGFRLWKLDEEHEQVYKEPSLSREVAGLISLWSDVSKIRPSPPMVDVPGVAYRASYACRYSPRWLRARRSATIRVKVTNTSKQIWPPGERSGLHLGYRWLDSTGRVTGDPGESIALPREVPPGQSIDLKIKITAPAETGARVLEIDMVDEGLMWFSEKQSQHPTKPLRLGINIHDQNLFKHLFRPSAAKIP